MVLLIQSHLINKFKRNIDLICHEMLLFYNTADNCSSLRQIALLVRTHASTIRYHNQSISPARGRSFFNLDEKAAYNLHVKLIATKSAILISERRNLNK